MAIDLNAGVIAHAIQLSTAPVFLLTGVAGLLNVMAVRLARIVDRARSLEAGWKGFDADEREAARRELQNLEKRRHVCSWAINSSTAAALLVCLVIVSLFVEEFFETNIRGIAGGLFVGSMVLVSAGLVCFLREVTLATAVTAIDHTKLR